MSLLRDLLALAVLLMALPVVVGLFLFASRFDIDYREINEEIELMKLREVLLLSYERETYNNELSFIYQGVPYSLSLVNGKLLLQPGTVIYMSDLESLCFEEDGTAVRMSVTRNGREEDYVLCAEKSLRIGDLSYCDDELSEPVRGDE